MKKISADRIFSGDGEIWNDRVIILDDKGMILAIDPLKAHDPATVKHYPGVLCPGFINAHCHLELSHMKGVIPTGTGLLPFIKSVVQLRDFDQEVIDEAIRKADEEMLDQGIVAVGDISNKTDTAQIKSESPIRYHTFVEVFDFIQDDLAEEMFGKAVEVWEKQPGEGMNSKSIVPHAPYSVSPTLFHKINSFNHSGQSVSIHNQETPHEDLMFLDGTGDLIPLWKSFGFSMDDFVPEGKSSLQHTLPHLRKDQRVLLVHNTQSSKEDIEAAIRWNEKVFWVTCANANLYIENRLPRYEIFEETGAKVCIGTDSLSSNWQLSILEEMKVIQRYKSSIALNDLIQWACINGAEALGYEDEIGSFKTGKRPGINHLDIDANELILKAHHEVERVA